VSGSDSIAYWEEQCRQDPDAWLKHCLELIEIPEKSIDLIMCIRGILTMYPDIADGVHEFKRTINRKVDKMSVTQLGILIKQEVIRLAKRTGKTDEEIDQIMAAIENVRRDRGSIQATGPAEAGAKVEFHQT
jgi:hypothetical protein